MIHNIPNIDPKRKIVRTAKWRCTCKSNGS